MAINIKSYNQQLGDLIRKIVANTPANDINPASTLMTILEAVASNDFENNTAILNVLELLNIDTLRNNDLDARASDYGLSRKSAARASGFVTLSDSTITKRSTGLYPVKPAPIKGSTTIYVNDASDWNPTGNLYIGRGTSSFEGPIPYTAITNFTTYYAITLGSSLQKDHLQSDSVIDAQGTIDRLIPAGTVVKIPSNNQNPEIQYTTLREAVIAAGEDTITGVEVVATDAGSNGNAGINTIVSFNAPPFSGAIVTNVTAFTNGSDIESDLELRERIKSYSQSLARGTKAAIIIAVEGIQDPDDSKQVASAVITEAVSIEEPSILYIDDGSSFEPSYQGQSVDLMVDNANGDEEFLQLANYPIPRPQVVNVAEGPYDIKDGSIFRVVVDGQEETVSFDAANFVNISAATAAELIVVMNDNSTLFKARFTEDTSRILLYPVAHDAEIIQVSPIKDEDNPTLFANNILKFPTDEFSYIALYQNNERLKEKAKAATIDTTTFASWNITTSGNVIIAVDGTPTQDRTFALSDFPGAASFSILTLEDWVTVFNQKFAGLTAEATPSQTMKITSNKTGDESRIEISGGTYLNKWFPNIDLIAVGQSAEFQLNRQTGNLRILNDILPGDNISAGIEDAKGFILSSETTSGTYNVAADANGRPSELVIVVDSSYCDQVSVPLLLGTTITISDQGSGVMRVMSSAVDTFASLKPGDHVYIVKRTSGWLSANNCGLYKMKAKGEHTNAGVDTYIEVLNDSITSESATAQDTQDIKAFTTDAYPQIWRGLYASNPPSEPIDGLVATFNDKLMNVKAQVYRSKAIKLTSTTEKNGSISIPIAVGNVSAIFSETAAAQTGNPPHVANRVSDKSLVAYFKRSAPVSTNIWLDRHVYADIHGLLSTNAVPDQYPFSGTYSETVEASPFTSANVGFSDLVSFVKGNNRGQFRSIKALIGSDEIGTQQSTPRTEFDHISSDDAQIIKSLSFAADDNIVFVMDKDPSVKTVDIKMARTGKVNSGSNAVSYPPTTTQFSADDYDNEPGIDFSNANVWSTSLNDTDFSDYAMLMRARNWYASGGVAGSDGKMLLRASQFGISGNKLRFAIGYPTGPNQVSATTLSNSPSWSLFRYYFGSGSARAVGLAASDTISVKGPYPNESTNFPNGTVGSGDYWDYTFSAGNFASVQVGDIVSIRNGSGISAANQVVSRVAAISGNTIRLYNLLGSNTTPGNPEVTTVTTIADVQGTPTDYVIDTVADVAGSLNGTYFTIYDTAGSVAIWFDINNSGTPMPPHGANRAIKIATVQTNDTANAVAARIYDYLVLDNAFNAAAIGNQVTLTNKQNGALSTGTANTSGFTVTTNVGTNNASIDGKYFLLYDEDGSVAVWYDVGNDGTPEPFHGANRSIKVSGVNYGDSATTVAAATVAVINPDLKFSASNLGSTITVTNAANGDVTDAAAGTSGFTVSSTSGSFGSPELITNPALIDLYPLTGTDVASIVSKINEKDIIKAVAIGNDALTISKSTQEETYVYGGNSTALAFGHNPNSMGDKDHINLYDGQNYIKSFSNSNPNFVLKTALTLNGVAPSVYQMDTAPNFDTVDLGEQFKLVPTTVKNVHHHMTQKALSQLPIVANVDISNQFRNIQVTSKLLGSQGGIEVVGGRANLAQAYIMGESEIASDINGSHLLAKIPVFPDTFSTGDTVKITNDAGVKRLSRLSTNDKIDVSIPSSGFAEYGFDPKTINVSSLTDWTITDVSGIYGRSSGIVWRWTHDGSATLADVKIGDMLFAFGTLSGWSQGNKSTIAGDGRVAGFPIVGVNDVANWIDVVNPYGRYMSTTSVGSGSTIQICPTPIIKWNLAHSARATIISISRVGSTVTVSCSEPHFLNSGNSVDIIDSDNLPDGVYTSITVTSPTGFTFTNAGSAFTEGSVGASASNAVSSVTRYTLEKMGFNDLMRLSRYDGASPRFLDCGVAVDDYMVLGGDTFKANNNGRFRVLGVTNDYVLFMNESGSDEVNTLTTFNNKGLQPSWTSNLNIVTGGAGTFKNLFVGDWVKKEEDPDDYYSQIVSMNASPASATSISLGSNYKGSTAIAAGIAYDQNSDHYTGVQLKNSDDIAFYEGDSVVVGDTLSVQNIINVNWFNVNNIGEFAISEVGTNATTYKPFLRVANAGATAEINRLMSVNTAGFFITESLVNKFYTYREIQHVSIDDLNDQRRSIYLTPANRAYKFSESNGTSIQSIGKLGYNQDITVGIDGYLYYTGLMRRVQRIVDGFEPDPENFPGRRAVGGKIESLPPLPKRISLTIDVTTDEGVNLGDISNNIKSTIITYVQNLGVGNDVILSEIIARVMEIKGVAAVTFTTPVPSTERIFVNENEKARIVPEDIGIA